MSLRSLVFNKLPRQTHQAGFGLIELMVAISVMVIVTSIVLARQSSFNGAVLLRSQAYEVALALREVQLSAVSASNDGSNNFRRLLGVYFDTSNTGNQQYNFFRDADGDGFYDAGEEYGLPGRLDGRFVIESIVATGGSFSGNDISVVFERPNFDAKFYDAPGSQVNASEISIFIRRVGSTGSDPGAVREVEITATGQISVP